MQQGDANLGANKELLLKVFNYCSVDAQETPTHTATDIIPTVGTSSRRKRDCNDFTTMDIERSSKRTWSKTIE